MGSRRCFKVNMGRAAHPSIYIVSFLFCIETVTSLLILLHYDESGDLIHTS
jgi:hypothetical protein